MAFQLTICKADRPAAEALKRKEIRDFDGMAPVRLGDPNGECPLEDIARAFAAIVPADNIGTAYQIELLDDSPLSVNGQPCPQKATALHSGDLLQCHGWCLQFHLKLPKAGLSWRSTILARISQLSIVLIVICLLATMFWLPGFLGRSNFWLQNAAGLEFSLAVDNARSQAKKIAGSAKLDSMSELLLASLTAELDNRARYLRTYENYLSSKQIAQMQKDIQDIVSWLDKLEAGYVFPELPSPDVDAAVKSILESQRKSPDDSK